MELADGLWSSCSCADHPRATRGSWCRDSYREMSEMRSHRRGGGAVASRRRSSAALAGLQRRLEALMQELFQLHDLNGDGLLEEGELVRLNEQIALLHHGEEADTAAVRSKYTDLFRASLDPHGRPVAYQKFRGYAWEVLEGHDTDPEAQEMILEQFVEEARSGRKAFALPRPAAAEPEPGRPAECRPPRDAPPLGPQRPRQGSLACCWA